MQNSINMVVSVGPGPSSLNWLARGSANGMEVESLNSVLGGKDCRGGGIHSRDSSSRTPQWRTLELVARNDRRPLRVLVDSGWSSNYIEAWECGARRIKSENEDHAQELQMADGIVVRTEARVQFMLKSGGYKGIISSRVFPI